MVAARSPAATCWSRGARADHLEALLAKLAEAGVADRERGATASRVRGERAGSAPSTCATTPYPGFPTDLQAQFMALMTRRDRRAASITETIFENRFMHVQELVRMGADIRVDGKTARRARRRRALGRAGDGDRSARQRLPRARRPRGAAARPRSSRVYHLDRGYERLEEKLSALGADIRGSARERRACEPPAHRAPVRRRGLAVVPARGPAFARRLACSRRAASARRARRARRARASSTACAAAATARSSRTRGASTACASRRATCACRAPTMARAARPRCRATVRRDLELAARRIRAFHRAPARALVELSRRERRAARAAGARRSSASACTCRAARAAYPSSVLMNVIPAQGRRRRRGDRRHAAGAGRRARR